MEINEWKWKTNDGLEMYSKAWIPSGPVKAVLCLVHGLGEHIGRFEQDGAIFAEAGYVLAGFDLRGHGKSGGTRGHASSPDDYFDDIDCFLREVEQKFPGKKRFIYGLSMGGILVLAYTPVRKPAVAGVIASAPGLKTALEKQKAKVFLAKVLGRLAPKMSMDNGIDVNEISRDPAVNEAYTKDPLVHRMVTTAWGRAMLQTIELAWKNAPNFPVPLLLVHGTADQIAYVTSSTTFAELAPKEKVTLKIWEGYKHEMRNDPEKAPVFKYMIDWLDAH